MRNEHIKGSMTGHLTSNFLKPPVNLDYCRENGINPYDARSEQKEKLPDWVKEHRQSVTYSTNGGRAVSEPSKLEIETDQGGSVSISGELQISPEDLMIRGGGSGKPSVCQKQ